MRVLVMNSGSSSQKTALFEVSDAADTDPIAPLWQGKIQWDGKKESLTIKNWQGAKIEKESSAGDQQASIEAMLRELWDGKTAVLQSPSEISVTGHRIVHGGPKLTLPAIITPEVKQTIDEVATIAPLHNRAGLRGVQVAEKLLGEIPQVAVFDTGFHRTLPLAEIVYAGPYEWYEQGIRRYGFHGINHEYCAHRVARLMCKDISSLKIISCHLGSGCSLAAVEHGQSVATTMGFTPMEGLMMGTRSGSIDPGILTHLMRTGNVQSEQLDQTLNHRSGLLGISGVSSDMRDVLEAIKSGNERAKLAFDIFVHRLQAGIGAMAASLNGLDALVFTAGIGENSPEVRLTACEKLGFLGVRLDEKKNSTANADICISGEDSAIPVYVIGAQEEWSIARECARIGLPNS
ncbi:MAG: acetate kinase [Acidobacteriaceae bacterium]